jgi:hypothetical protein
VGQKHALPQRNLAVRFTSVSGLATPELGDAKAVSLTLTATKSMCACICEDLYGWESKAMRVYCGRCLGFEESCQEEDTCGENRKVAQANSRRYETESVLRFRQILGIEAKLFFVSEKFVLSREVKAVSRSAISGGTDKLGALVR